MLVFKFVCFFNAGKVVDVYAKFDVIVSIFIFLSFVFA